MRKKFNRFVSLLLATALVLLLMPAAFLAAEDQNVRVGWFYQKGYQEQDENGAPCGYNYEYLSKIASANNWQLEFVAKDEDGEPLSWDKSLSMLADGSLDVMGCLLYTEERSAVFDFSFLSAGQTFTSLFVQTDSPLQANDYAAFNGITVATSVATVNDEALEAYAKQYGFSVGGYLDCPTLDDCMNAVLSGRADAGMFSSFQPTANTRIVASFAPQPFYFCTTKGNQAVLDGLNQAMNDIYLKDPYYALTLSSKYSQTYSGKTGYTAEELAFLASAAPVKVCFSNAWQTLIQYDEKTGTAAGVVAEILQIISRDTGLQFEYTHVETHREALELVGAGVCDMLPCCVYDVSTANADHLSQTDPYLSIQLVRVSKNEAPGESLVIGTLADFPEYDQTIKGDNISYRYYDSAGECFDALRRGEVTDIIVNSYAANYYLALSKYIGFVRTNLQGISIHACMAISQDTADSELLLSIIGKALSNIDATEINELMLEDTMQKSSSLETIVNRIPTMTAVWVILLLVLLLVLLSFFFCNYLRKAKQARKAAERIHNMLIMDELTGAYNERGFDLAARRALDEHPEKSWYLVDFDIAGFSHINALFGTKYGDDMLRSIARTTLDAIQPDELFARIYADHFICLLSGDSIEQIKQRILKANSVFRTVGSGNDAVLLNYGIKFVQNRSLPISTLCDRAQAAKRSLKGNYERIIAVYDEQMDRKQLEDAQLIAGMESGISNGEFVAYFQPQYDMKTERIVGAEALVRWKRGETLIQPGRFIELFEKNGLVMKLDFYMLDLVCRKLREQLDSGLVPKPVSLNFSRSHLYDSEFLSKIREIVAQYRLPHSLLVAEFTEYACLENADYLKSAIDGLHKLGMRVSLDDFGSGYSSLNMLKGMAFDELKLDRGFLSVSGASAREKIVIRSVLELSSRLGLSTVAEGVETREQLDYLRDNGCEVAQGFLFSRPVDGAQYDRLLQQDEAGA